MVKTITSTKADIQESKSNHSTSNGFSVNIYSHSNINTLILANIMRKYIEKMNKER